MTVLAHIWTPEGFVVAADGRGISAGTRRVLNDDRRKLIPLRALGVDLICGWLGVTQVAWKTGQVFDLSEETKRIGGVLSGEQSGLQYIERFSDNLRHCFTDALRPIFSANDAVALFVGYVDDRPKFWLWRLNVETEPQVKDLKMGLCCVLSGLREAPCYPPVAFTLSDARLNLHRYIQCCIENSDSYGGEIQIETITAPAHT